MAVLCFLLGTPGQSMVQEVECWRGLEVVTFYTETSEGLLFGFESGPLPPDFVLPVGWFYRATVPDSEIVLALYPLSIVMGGLVFGPVLYWNPFYESRIYSFEQFYFREFRNHWHHHCRGHPHWKRFHGADHAKGHYRGSRHSEKLSGKGAPLSTKAGKSSPPTSGKAGTPGSGSAKVRPPTKGKEGVRPPRPPDATKGGKAPATKKPSEVRPPKSSPGVNKPGSKGTVRPPNPSRQAPGGKSPTMRSPGSSPPNTGMRTPSPRPNSSGGGGRGGGGSGGRQQPRGKNK